MKIQAERSRYHRFALYYDYTPDRVEFCRILKDSFGWQRFSFESAHGLKRWVFSEALFVKLLHERFPDITIDPAVLHAVQQEDGAVLSAQEQHAAVDEVKQKKDTEMVVKGIKGEPYPYQKVGVEFLMASGGRAIIADPPGLGKSLQAIGYHTHAGFSRTLVVCPASVKFAWASEVRKWTNRSYAIIDAKTDLSEIPSDTEFWIINYDIVRKHFDMLAKTRFDLLVADECHYVKNHQAIRTKAVRALSLNIPHIVLLSGTPLLSRPVEMFTLLNMIDRRTWANWYEFTRRYCVPGDAPILMADLTEKPISKVKIGDKIIGWERKENGLRRLVVTEVKNTLRRKAPLQRVVLSNGDVVTSTPDHLWLTGMSIPGKPHLEYQAAREANAGLTGTQKPSRVAKIMDAPVSIYPESSDYMQGYLMGAFRGDGWCSELRMVRTSPFKEKPYNAVHVKRITSLPGSHTVYTLTTGTGNYVAYGYGSKNCDGHRDRFGYNVSGASHVDELHDRIRRYFIRRAKAEVLSQLPPKNRIDRAVELSKDAQKRYNAVEDDFVQYLQAYAGKQPAEIARIISAEKLTQLNVLRHLTAMGKIDAAKEIIDSIIEADEKILVFCSFLEPLEALRDTYGDQAVMLTGSTPVADRAGIVERFQNDPSAKVFLGGIKSSGVGITLTAAQNVLFLDYSWNPADHQQAEDRVHRPGQEAESVNIYQLYASDTIDDKLQQMLERKRKIFDRVVEGAPDVEEEPAARGEAVGGVVEYVLQRHAVNASRGAEVDKVS